MQNWLKSVTIIAITHATVLISLSAVYAHEQAIAFTEVSFITEGDKASCTADGCRIEIAHRLVIHDAESTLMNVLGTRSDLVADHTAQAKLESYVAERFALIDPESGQKLALTLLGGEVERGYYWVYQEGQVEAGHEVLLVSHTVLMDAIPSQTNLVNLQYHDQIKTLVFDTDTVPKPYRFE